MFIDDIRVIRKYFVNIVEQNLKNEEEMLAKFNEERVFFLKKAQKG
jgi:hypothetical protein